MPFSIAKGNYLVLCIFFKFILDVIDRIIRFYESRIMNACRANGVYEIIKATDHNLEENFI